MNRNAPMRLLPLVLAVMLAVAPALSWARPVFSGGSRGTHTYTPVPGTSTSPYGAAPMQRSITPNYGSGSSGYGSTYGSRYRGSPFTSGLLGGLIGAGIGGMLFGGGFFGGMHGGGGFLGFLIQMALLYFAARWLFRRFAGVPAAAGPGFFARNFAAVPGFASGSGGGGMGRGNRPVAIQPADYQAFEQLLKNVQAAWSAHDLNGLSQFATPEMVGYFGEQLAEQASRGVRNQVTDVRLQQGDLAEAWSEGSREYATVALRYSMVDVTFDPSRRVVDGSLTERVTATEVWTFVRTPGGRWLLSAIQQTR
jgi:predicted lipid-binding transport protein (Tim44 family)